jgi:hypothetical protein
LSEKFEQGRFAARGKSQNSDIHEDLHRSTDGPPNGRTQ